MVRMTSDEYAEKRGIKCPCCCADDCEGQSIDIIEGHAYQTVVCNNCGASWEDVYKLVGYENLEECKE